MNIFISPGKERRYPHCPPLAGVGGGIRWRGWGGGSIALVKSLYVSLYKRETLKKALLSLYERGGLPESPQPSFAKGGRGRIYEQEIKKGPLFPGS